MLTHASPLRRFAVAFVVFVASVAASQSPALAIVDCVPTRSDDIREHDVVVFCRIVGGAKAVPVDKDGRYLCEPIEFLKGAATLKKQPGAKAPYHFEALVTEPKPDDAVYFAYAYINEKQLEWVWALQVNDREQEYLRALGKSYANGAERVKALLPFLEATDELITRDIDVELVGEIPYRDIRAAGAALPVDKLRTWIKASDPEEDYTRLGTCLHLLGACGTKEDLPMLEEMIFGTVDPKRRELYRSVACYLMLGGEPAFTAVEKAYLHPIDRKLNESWDGYYAYLGVEYAAKEGAAIPRERWLAFYRPLLDLSRFTHHALLELVRLEDWDSTEKIVKMSRVERKESHEYWLRGAIAHYLRRNPRPEAKARFEELKKLDPDAVKLFEDVK